MITDISQLDLKKKYSYADYLTWKFKERVELFRGRIFKMSPAPSLLHQRVVGKFFRLLGDNLNEGKPRCEVYIAPADVLLPVSFKKGEVSTVVQPDIFVVCDAEKTKGTVCNGAPDLIVEVLSPGNSTKEMRYKFDLYQEAEVKEYWLVHPIDETVIVYKLNEYDQYIGSRIYTNPSKVKSTFLKGFELDLAVLFNG